MKYAIVAAIILMIAAALYSAPVERSVEGDWLGTLEVSGMELRLVFHISVGEDGGLSCAMDSPDQGAKGIPTDSVIFEADSLVIEVASISGRYVGKMLPDSLVIVGEWRQAGYSIPLRLEKMEGEVSFERYQDPKRPFPYREEEVVIENREAGVELAGTLTMPPGEEPFPAAILISGSGAQDRDETILGHRPFLVLSDHLTRGGIAVLRYDDRGVGGSSGSHVEATTEDLATDAAAAVRYLRGREEIDGSKIGLIGHSEGAIIAPMVAGGGDRVSFIVMLAGTGVKGSKILLDQNRMILSATGVPGDLVDRMVAQLEDEYEALAEFEDDERAREEVLRRSMEHIGNFTEEEKEEYNLGEETIRNRIDVYLTPWLRFFMRYDPAPALAALECPVMVLMGGKDLQVGSQANLKAIRKALGDATVVELPGLNHLFQTAETGAPAEYGRIEETIAPAVLDTVTVWIRNIVDGDLTQED